MIMLGAFLGRIRLVRGSWRTEDEFYCVSTICARCSLFFLSHRVVLGGETIVGNAENIQVESGDERGNK